MPSTATGPARRGRLARAATTREGRAALAAAALAAAVVVVVGGVAALVVLPGGSVSGQVAPTPTSAPTATTPTS